MSRQFVIQGIEFRPLMWWGKKSKVKVKQLRIEYDMKSQTAMVGVCLLWLPHTSGCGSGKKDAGRQRWRRRWKKRINLKSVFIEKYITEALRDAVCHFNCCSSYLRCPQMKYVQTDVGGPAAHTNYSRHVYYPQCDFIILFFFVFRQIEHGFENARIFITARMRTRKNQWNFASEYLSERACCACWLSNA